MNEYDETVKGRVRYSFGDDADVERDLLETITSRQYRVLVKTRDGKELTGQAERVADSGLELSPWTEAEDEPVLPVVLVPWDDLEGIHVW